MRILRPVIRGGVTCAAKTTLFTINDNDTLRKLKEKLKKEEVLNTLNGSEERKNVKERRSSWRYVT